MAVRKKKNPGGLISVQIIDKSIGRLNKQPRLIKILINGTQLILDKAFKSKGFNELND